MLWQFCWVLFWRVNLWLCFGIWPCSRAFLMCGWSFNGAILMHGWSCKGCWCFGVYGMDMLLCAVVDSALCFSYITSWCFGWL